MESCVRGFHVYKDIWIPAIGEVLSCKGEDKNIMDSYRGFACDAIISS